MELGLPGVSPVGRVGLEMESRDREWLVLGFVARLGRTASTVGFVVSYQYTPIKWKELKSSYKRSDIRDTIPYRKVQPSVHSRDETATRYWI